jgi:membrane protein YdbS with pleckstrin-like domain
MENTVIKEAAFDPAVKTYIFLIVLFYLFVSIIGILVIPIWLLGFGQWLSNKFYHTLKCQLSSKNLKFSKGLIFRMEKTIPLENIQDLSFFGGPILRSMGLTMIKVETAGGGGPHHSNAMSMLGVTDAENFKNMILHQRELVVREKNQVISTGHVPSGSAGNDQLLNDIKNELTEIKNILKANTKS